jgi:hypothetical protein
MIALLYFLLTLFASQFKAKSRQVAPSSVTNCMAKRSRPPSQGRLTFLRNHAPDIAAMNLFVVPTIGFDLLYAIVIVWLARRALVWINVTASKPNPGIGCAPDHGGVPLE